MPTTHGQPRVSGPAGGANVKALRRLGCRPSGRAPASEPSTSAHAPPASTTTGARKAARPSRTPELPGFPLAAHARDPLDIEVAPQLGARRLGAAQVMLMQRMHVDVAGVIVVQGSDHGLVAQHRHQRLRCLGVQQRHSARAFGQQPLVQAVQGLELRRPRREQRPPRCQHAGQRLQESRGWRVSVRAPAVGRSSARRPPPSGRCCDNPAALRARRSPRARAAPGSAPPTRRRCRRR